MNKHIAVLCCVTAAISMASADVLFSEDFEDPVVGGNTAISSFGWANDVANDDVRVYTDGPGLQSVWSWNGGGTTEAFYTAVGMGAGFAAIDPTAYEGLQMSLDNHTGWNGADSIGYFAVQMNSTDWYVSTASVALPVLNTWVTHQMDFDPTASAWNTLTVSGTGSSSSGATVGGAAGSDLSGLITGIGVVINHDAGSGTMNFDNVMVESIPEPATIGMIAMMGGGLLFIRRRFMM